MSDQHVRREIKQHEDHRSERCVFQRQRVVTPIRGPKIGWAVFIRSYKAVAVPMMHQMDKFKVAFFGDLAARHFYCPSRLASIRTI